MLLGAQLLLIVVVAAANANPTPDQVNYYYAPLVANPLTGVQLSERSADATLHNEFLRIIQCEITLGLICSPSYYDIDELSTLVYCTYSKHL